MTHKLDWRAPNAMEMTVNLGDKVVISWGPVSLKLWVPQRSCWPKFMVAKIMQDLSCTDVFYFRRDPKLALYRWITPVCALVAIHLLPTKSSLASRHLERHPKHTRAKWASFLQSVVLSSWQALSKDNAMRNGFELMLIPPLDAREEKLSLSRSDHHVFFKCFFKPPNNY